MPAAFVVVVIRVRANDDQIAGVDQMSGRAIDADDSGVSLAGDHISRQAVTVVDVVNLNLFVVDEIGQLHQRLIDGDASRVMEVRIGDGGSMNF